MCEYIPYLVGTDLLTNIHPDIPGADLTPQASPEGLQHPLYPHQLVALRWMKQMEGGKNKGGILADDMGLGKTISALALILARPAARPPTSDRNVHQEVSGSSSKHAKARIAHMPQTNLIIGPLSLLQQWGEETTKKIKPLYWPKVMLYHNKRATIDDLLTHDIVVTTYGTLAQEFKHYEQFIETNNGRTIDFRDKSYAAQFPLLHETKARFRRIILDLAQCIKNRKTKRQRLPSF